MLYETRALQQVSQYSFVWAAKGLLNQEPRRMLRKQDCIKFRGRIAWQSFFENNFASFYDVVRVKKNQDFIQPLVAFPIIATSPILSFTILQCIKSVILCYLQ